MLYKLLNVPVKKAQLTNEDHYLSILFLNSQPEENGFSPADKLFNCPICTNLPSAKPQRRPSTTNAAIELATQNRLSTLKPGDTARIKQMKRKPGIQKDQLLPQITALARTTS